MYLLLVSCLSRGGTGGKSGDSRSIRDALKHVRCDQADDKVACLPLAHWSEHIIRFYSHIQVALVVIDIAFDLLPKLNISEGSTQPIGAKEYEKLTS